MKQCKTCGELKSLDEYFNSKNNAGGKVPHCKPCMQKKVNKEAVNACSKRYRDNHPEKRLERNRRYRKENPEKMRKIATDYGNARYRTDPIYRLQTILRQQVVDYIKYRKSERTAQLLGYTAEEFLARYGEGSVGDHLDHKIPKSWFKDDAPVSLVWHIENLHWLPGIDNSSKYNNYMHPVSESYLQQALPYIKEEFAGFVKK